MDADNRPGLPLSLQDMCMLCIMLRLEEFPTDSLALLPSAIRRRLFLGLAHADLLHVDTEVLFGDLHYSGLDPSREDYHQRGPAVAREELLDVILHGSTSSFFSLNLEATLDCYQWVKLTRDDGEFDLLIEHICKCYLSLEPTMVPLSYKDGVVILPKRFLQFVILHWKHNRYSQSKICQLQVPLEMAQPLLKYCKMQSAAPPNLMIDCCSFQTTMFWKKFEEDCDRLRNKSPIETMDPVIPFLQEFLSSVEVLELNTDILKDRIYETTHTVLFVILYNIVTSSQPRLKHLKIHGVPYLTDWGLDTVSELIFKTKSHESVLKAMHNSVPLASNIPKAYPLEGLSVLPHYRSGDYANEYIVSSNVLSVIQILLKCHMHTLKHVTIQGISFSYHDDDAMNVRGYDENLDESDDDDIDKVERNFRTCKVNVLASFTQLLRQPQLCALSVGKSSLSGARALIKTFLNTPASHKQALHVEGIDEQDPMEREDKDEDEEDEEERKAITSNDSGLTWSRKTSFLPETNTQFKCLDLGHSSSCIHSLLFSLPELKLRKLRMRTQDMTLVPASTAIKVEHLVFSTQTNTSYKPTISPAHLEKFVISNPVLKKLEFEHPTDECAPGLIPALIHCLSKLYRYQQGKGLDELVLDSIMLDHTDIRELFMSMRHLNGTTLVLTPICYQEESSLLVDLGKEFQETKIKKIVCNMTDRHTDPHSQLDPLAEEVVVHYPSCFYTKAGRKCYYPSCADINLLSGRIQYFGGSWQGIPTDKDQED